ncbi:acyl carrier protein [Embleya hyalina]|uniref:Acyl carrier protein n=1 Tax=Embleya hyalina TaxID=516124 RepID=A0A401Z1P6_9ACTN|nr:acyl carrier protein [Embleya hyalina]GCE00800.1 acyl carrier protein [Embleya hyalina]
MYEALKDVLVGDLHVTDTTLRPETTLDDAGLDSLALVELSMVLRQKLGIDISDDELANVGTIEEIADLMSRHAADAR